MNNHWIKATLRYTLLANLGMTALVAGGPNDKKPYTPLGSKQPLSANQGVIETGGVIKAPYLSDRVYKIYVVPGSPVMVELPMGESPENIWYDTQYWKAESTPGSNRLVVKALNVDNILGKRTSSEE